MHDLNSTRQTTQSTPAEPAPSSSPLPGGPDSQPPLRRKRCRACGRDLPLTHFYRQRGCRDPHRPDCKSCTSVRTREMREAKIAHRAAPPTVACRGCHELKPRGEFPPDHRYGLGCRPLCHKCRAEAHSDDARRDLNLPDEPLIPPSRLRVDLGLAIAAATCPPGHCRTQEEIAAFTGLPIATVRAIEIRALAKLRKAADRLLQKA